MKISEYQKRAYTSLNDHESDKDRNLNWLIGLSEEAGEVLNMFKHHYWGGEEVNKEELAQELGDVLWYLSAVASHNGIDLEASAELNILKLENRYKSGYSEADSQNRKEKSRALKDTGEYKELMRKVIK